MKYIKIISQLICITFALALFVSFSASSSYAMTAGQKSIGNIGTEITWYEARA